MSPQEIEGKEIDPLPLPLGTKLRIDQGCRPFPDVGRRGREQCLDFRFFVEINSGSVTEVWGLGTLGVDIHGRIGSLNTDMGRHKR